MKLTKDGFTGEKASMFVNVLNVMFTGVSNKSEQKQRQSLGLILHFNKE